MKTARRFLFTSESVSPGHPDKLCDFISDSILDELIKQDSKTISGCETVVKNQLCIVAGEITTTASVSYECIVRKAMKEVGYDDKAKGLDYKSAIITVAIDPQSIEISNAVYMEKAIEDIGAGDQGLMIGYATDETPELMPCTIMWAHNLCRRLYQLRKDGSLPWLRPDAKSQVTVEYEENGNSIKPIRVHTVLISTQHNETISTGDLRPIILEKVIKEVIPSSFIDSETIFHINPSGSFITGGPVADVGLTGRKIIVDTYGGWGGHGGGCFSGKDPTKMDRTGGYAARWVAKSLVAAGFAPRVMVQLAYGIGIPHPISINIHSYNTVKSPFTDSLLEEIVKRNFDLRPGFLIRDLNLRRPIFAKTSTFGHFGRTDDPDFTWETPKDLSHEKL